MKPSVVALSLALVLLAPFAAFAAGPITVNLGTARNFVILSKAGVASVGAATVIGNIGVSPISSTALTGFELTIDQSGAFSTSPGVTGKIYAADYTVPTRNILLVAVNDMQNAYIKTARRTNPTATDLGAGNIGGMTIGPGIYKWSTGVRIPEDVTLSGAQDDVWIFQIAGTLDESSGKNVLLSGGAQAQNIFWQVEGDTTIGASAVFNGNLLDNAGIVLQSGAELNGRALSLATVTLADTAAVTMSENVTPPVINIPVPDIPREATSTITVVKTVVNHNGAAKTVADFPLFVNGTPIVSGVDNLFPANATYTITEAGDPNYTGTFSGDCDANGFLRLATGDHKVCIVTNEAIAPAEIAPIAPTPTSTSTSTPEPTPTSTLDTTPPVITLNGEAVINLNVGDTYTDPGAIAADDIDSSVPVVESGAVDTSTIGTYTIAYNATDAAGNHAAEVTRTVNVSAPSPGLPNTGLPSQKKPYPLNIVILCGIVALIAAVALVLYKTKVRK